MNKKSDTSTNEILTLIESLSSSQQENVIDYIQFLKSQSKKD